MLNRPFRVIWLKLHIQGKRNFRFSIPISMNVLLELLDSIYDLTALICVFLSETPASRRHNPIHITKDIVAMLLELCRTITDDGPYDLVDVTADDVKVSLKIR